MVTKHINPRKNLNPNWSQLQEKLKSDGPKNHFSRHSSKPDEESERNILGKRKERSDEESQASRPHPLIPTSLDCSHTDVVAMDCEMVGVSATRNKSAVGRVTLVSVFTWSAYLDIIMKPSADTLFVWLLSQPPHLTGKQLGNVIYDEYVRPMAHVVDFRTEISGIRPRDLKSAKNFNLVQNKVAEMINGRIVVGHALRNDLKVLLLSHPKNDIRDTADYAPFLKEGRSRSLKNLAAQFLSVEIQNGEHCPVEDARAAMLLYQKNRNQWERSAKDFIRLKEKQKKRKHKKRKLNEG